MPIEDGRTITANSVEVTASALIEDDKSFERFDTNLPLAGIVVVDIKLVNRSPVKTKSLTFALQDASGRQFPLLDANKELKQVLKFDGVRLYSKVGRQETLDLLQSISIPKKLVLAAQEERRGVLFFHAKQDVAQLKGLILTVKGMPQPLGVPLQ